MEENQFSRDEDWAHVLSMLPADLEETCRSKLAIQRAREIHCAGDLLRLCLVYGVCDLSLRHAAAWAAAIGLAEMSDVAVLKRLCAATNWLGHLVMQWLTERGLTSAVPGRRVRVVDSSVISTPGPSSKDYRLHTTFDLAQRRLADVELTEVNEAESLQRHVVGEGEVLLADRGYGKRPQIAEAVQEGAHVVVRIHFMSLPLENAAGKPIDTLRLLETLRSGEIGDWPVFMRHGKRRFAMRLVAVKKSRAAAERSMEKAKRKAQHNGTARPDPRSLRAAHYTYVLTDLTAEEIPAAQVLELYRLRWQIELAFKRLKSLLRLKPRAHKPELTKTYLFANILGALIIDELCGNALSFFPWGFPLFRPSAEPLASV
jgi:hypothetical protein